MTEEQNDDVLKSTLKYDENLIRTDRNGSSSRIGGSQ